MKSKIKILGLLVILITFSVIFTRKASAQQPYVSFQVFYDYLSPYGQWVDYPGYGYVWIPNAESDFFPYSTGGHWIMTDYGWTWASDYNWGWAPFHYGRWDYDNSYGWFWIPGNEWGPAWVSWRRSNGYYGWSPMGPGLTITASFGRAYDGRGDRWMFVRDRDFDRPDINRYYINRTDNDRIIRTSTVISNTYVDSRRRTTYVSGPGRDEVQHVTGRRVSPVTIQENNSPGQNLNNGQLRIYRPQVTPNNIQQKKPVPSRIVNLRDVKTTSQRNVTNQPKNINPSQNNIRVNQPNTVNRQNPVNQPNTVNRQNPVNQPNTVNRQNPVNQPNTVNRQKPVNQPNTVNRQNPVNQSNTVNQQNRANQQNNINRQNNNNNAKSLQPQNQNPSNNTGQIRQTNTVNPQNTNNNNGKSLQPQNANPSSNRRVQKQNTVVPSNKNKVVTPEKSNTEQDKKKEN